MEESGTSGQGQEFKYVFGERDDVLIVMLAGKIRTSDTPILEMLMGEIGAKNQPIVLLSFKDVSGLAPGNFVSLAKLQKSIRDSKKLLGLCFLSEEIMTQLTVSGIIREEETFANLAEAFQKSKAKLKARQKAGPETNGLKKST